MPSYVMVTTRVVPGTSPSAVCPPGPPRSATTGPTTAAHSRHAAASRRRTDTVAACGGTDPVRDQTDADHPNGLAGSAPNGLDLHGLRQQLVGVVVQPGLRGHDRLTAVDDLRHRAHPTGGHRSEQLR